MKLTKSQLKKIIKEEFDILKEQDPFQDAVDKVTGIRDAIVGYVESEKLFELGAIPPKVIRAIEEGSSLVATAIAAQAEADLMAAAYKKNPEFF